eukprot:15458282-Alexandrium_andersonii.AAC.1
MGRAIARLLRQASFFVASAGGTNDLNWQAGGRRLARAVRNGVNSRRAGRGSRVRRALGPRGGGRG